MREEDGGHVGAAAKATLNANGTQRAIQVLLENLRHGHAPPDESPPTPANSALDLLYDHAVLSRAQETLLQQSQDKLLDVVFQACICAMIGVLNLFLDPDLPYTWRKASIVVAKAQGHGPSRARCIRKWILDFVWEGKFPLHSYCYSHQTVLGDEDVLQEIQEALSEKAKNSFVKAEDLCEIVMSERLQTLFARLGIRKPTISQSTAQRWLAKMNW